MVRKVTRVDKSKTGINSLQRSKWNWSWLPGSSPHCLAFMLSTTNMAAEFFISRFLSIDFPVIIYDWSVGSIRLFLMVNDKISANSHHFFLQILHENILPPDIGDLNWNLVALLVGWDVFCLGTKTSHGLSVCHESKKVRVHFPL